MTQPPTPPTPPATKGTYRKRGPKTWAVIKEQYLAGETARVLAERHDVSVHAIRKRASRGQWRKSDLPDRPTITASVTGADDPGDIAGAARRAAILAVEALGHGKLALATAYAKVAESLSRVGARLGGRSGPDPDSPLLEPDEDVLALLARRVAEIELADAR